jgi:hypothetical protein
MKNEELRMKNALSVQVRSAVALGVAMLREIFDENAYSRYLACHNLTSSRESYRAFLRESSCQRERRARCC